MDGHDVWFEHEQGHTIERDVIHVSGKVAEKERKRGLLNGAAVVRIVGCDFELRRKPAKERRVS